MSILDVVVFKAPHRPFGLYIRLEEYQKKDKLNRIGAKVVRQASINRDLETLLSLFTEDGIAIPPEGEIIEGKEALRNMLKQNFELMQDHIITEYNQDFKEIKVLGQYAYEWGIYNGKYKSKEDDKEITGGGKLMRILRLQVDGSWKVYRAIWTVDK
ncbi:MAG: DUF4440 domain-containing protein [Phycisphaerae bacterium]